MKRFLRPCLVIGTGFHRWVLGESMWRNVKPLLDWNELLLKVAKDLRVPLHQTEHSLSIHWEHMLSRARNEIGYDKGMDGRATTCGYTRKALRSAFAVLAD